MRWPAGQKPFRDILCTLTIYFSFHFCAHTRPDSCCAWVCVTRANPWQLFARWMRLLVSLIRRPAPAVRYRLVSRAEVSSLPVPISPSAYIVQALLHHPIYFGFTFFRRVILVFFSSSWTTVWRPNFSPEIFVNLYPHKLPSKFIQNYCAAVPPNIRFSVRNFVIQFFQFTSFDW